MHNQLCKDCFWFDEITLTNPGPEFVKCGHCRANPPVVLADGTTRFPVVKADSDWCREFSRNVK